MERGAYRAVEIYIAWARNMAAYVIDLNQPDIYIILESRQ